MGEGVDLPDNFPEDFPIYEGARATGSFSTSQNEGEGLTVTFVVDAGFDDVSSFYKEELPAAGYNINTTIDMGDAAQFYFINEEKGIEGVLQVMKEDGQTGISVTMGF